VVHRIDYSVYFKRLESEEFALLSGLGNGKSLSEAAAAAFEGSDVTESEILSTVQSWFANWSTLGWLCGLTP
jgi:hypothetical protein